jgi:hypothetical protein
MGSRATAFQVSAAVAVLAFGAVFYMVGRPVGHAYLLISAPQFLKTPIPSLGGIGGWLPSFLHVFAFTLLTTALLSRRSLRASAGVATAWCVTDALFELGQHPAVAPLIAAALPTWFAGVPLLENTGPYFLRGSFDPLDLAATVAGGGVAFLAVAWSDRHWRTS